MRRYRLLLRVWLFIFVLSLCGCTPDAKRFGDRYKANYNENRSPQFQACSRSIREAYASMDAIKYRGRNTGSYGKWIEADALLAQALSARENRKYFLCLKRAKEVVLYINRHMK